MACVAFRQDVPQLAAAPCGCTWLQARGSESGKALAPRCKGGSADLKAMHAFVRARRFCCPWALEVDHAAMESSKLCRASMPSRYYLSFAIASVVGAAWLIKSCPPPLLAPEEQTQRVKMYAELVVVSSNTQKGTVIANIRLLDDWYRTLPKKLFIESEYIKDQNAMDDFRALPEIRFGCEKGNAAVRALSIVVFSSGYLELLGPC